MDRRTFLTGLAGVIPSEILLSDLDFNGTRTLNHTFNPRLPYYKTPPEWKGTPRPSDGTFQNLYHPFEASLAAVLINVPMHFGTFDLSDEPLLEPLDWLKANPEAVNDALIEPVVGRNLFAG